MLPEIGEEGQRKLARAKVLVVGLGGLGCPVCLYLTGAGTGHIGLCDSDTVSLSNLQRQTLYSEETVGQPKVSAAHRRLSSLCSDTKFELFSSGLTPDNAERIISQYDLVVDCCDNYATRYLIDDVCHKLSKPWVFGAIGQFEGRVSTFLPGGIRYSDIFADRAELESMPPSRGGVLGAVPGIVGAIEAAEAIKIICGFGELLSGLLLFIDVRTMTFNKIEI